ncbi:hypothetical protein BU17DRAFT_92801 [Hysterangium stoloniferum]|nr:hypothetical protein BU17DRAFT_92801 [Hysterangium stoloniferum]
MSIYQLPFHTVHGGESINAVGASNATTVVQGVQGYSGPLMPAAYMEELYLHINNEMERDRLAEDIKRIKLSKFQQLLVDQSHTPPEESDTPEPHPTDIITKWWQPSTENQSPLASSSHMAMLPSL